MSASILFAEEERELKIEIQIPLPIKNETTAEMRAFTSKSFQI
jgi:hypothetical protein